MSNILPIVLWYGGLLGILAAGLFMLWALGLYALKQVTGAFVMWLLVGALVLAAGSSWAVPHAISLKQESQLIKVHEALMRLVAGSVYARATLEDVRAVAEPSPGLTTLQSKYDAYEASIESLLQAEWQYYRGGPWDERSLLYKTTWDLNEVRIHHARWEKRAEALECPSWSGWPALSDLTGRLQDGLQTQRKLAEAIGEQLEGYDINAPEARPSSDATTIKWLAAVLGGLSLLGGAAVFLVWRKRSWYPIDGLVAIAVVVLVNLAGWLALGAGADQEQLRANLFARAATVYRESFDLNDSVKTLMLVQRGGVLQPRDSSEKLITDYATYMNAVNGLTLLVRLWDRAVLTGVLDVGLVSSERIQSHDDLVNAVRSRTLTLFRQYLQLDRRITDLSCRSEWFPRDGNRTREDELLTLSTTP
jgi:hypothetical protein